ncbi:hypothetical protein D3C71_1618010 [compost metagenome]
MGEGIQNDAIHLPTVLLHLFKHLKERMSLHGLLLPVSAHDKEPAETIAQNHLPKQLKRRVIGPLQIIEEQDERTLIANQTFEQPNEGLIEPVRLLCRIQMLDLRLLADQIR